MLPLLVGLAPALLLILYIYFADHLQREPLQQLKRAVGFGVGSLFVSLFFSTLLEAVGLDLDGQLTGMEAALNQAFFGAAIPEECAKLLMLWLVTMRNPHFDEHMDGIVYSVCVGMGFAGCENVMYVMGAGDEWLSVGVIRAMLSVPGHYYNAVMMGYYYSLVRFDAQHRTFNVLLMLLTPILAHGIFDFFLMFMDEIDSSSVQMLLLAALIASCIAFYRFARQRVTYHLERDRREHW